RNLAPSPSVLWCAGLIDNTTSTAGILAAFGDSEAVLVAYANPTGTSTATAIANRPTWAVETYTCIARKAFCTVFDPINNVNRSLPPYAWVCGRTCTLGPHQSPLNQQVYNIIGTERNDPITGSIPYSATEIGQLNAAGIVFIA